MFLTCAKMTFARKSTSREGVLSWFLRCQNPVLIIFPIWDEFLFKVVHKKGSCTQKHVFYVFLPLCAHWGVLLYGLSGHTCFSVHEKTRKNM
jgi:hypothetical protein